MSSPSPMGGGARWTDVASLVARLILGVLYVSMGLAKASAPVEFMKLVRQYGVVDTPPVLNLIAVALPWFEIFCGLLLVGGIGVRGAALVSLGMLIPFTGLVFNHALELHAGSVTPFCAIRFDCGCGAGEVAICNKLAENAGLALLSIWLLVARPGRWCLRHAIVRG